MATNNARLETSLLVVDSDYFCQHLLSHLGHDTVSFGTPIQQVQLQLGAWLEETLRDTNIPTMIVDRMIKSKAAQMEGRVRKEKTE